MATDEEYLDNLLKSLTESDSESVDDETFSMSSDDIGIDADMLADLLAEAMPAEDNETGKTDLDLSADVFADLLAEDSGSDPVDSNENVLTDLLAGGDDPVSDNSTMFDDMEEWQSDLDDLLAEADAQVGADANSAHSGNNLDNADIDLEDIGGLLKKADDNEVDAIIEDDMLALPEGGQIDKAESDDDGAVENSDLTTENIEDPASAKAKRKKEKEEKKKKKEKKRLKQKGNEETLDGEKTGEQQEVDQDKEKPGFFSKMLTYLTQEEDELAGVSEENAEILQELDEEDKIKEKKAGKKKKKKEKAKAAPEEGEDGDAEADTKKKKKKEKKKKDKEPGDAVKEKPVKVLSKGNILVLVAACATLIACVLIFSTFLPEYADKQNAHQAFYDGEYEEVYRLLYDKNLGSNDTLIFNKAKVILTIERKLKSYEGNITMNRELEALDALMQGMNCYQELAGTDVYGMEIEVESVYQQICGILQNNYGITPEEAMEINAYDNELYTRKLISVIEGTEFSLPGEEAPIEDLPPQDILPEEEEIISY